MPKLNQKLGDTIRLYRKAEGLTQMQLAEKLGVGRTTVGEYEAGRNEPDVKMLIKLADIFDISLDELLGRENI